MGSGWWLSSPSPRGPQTLARAPGLASGAFQVLDCPGSGRLPGGVGGPGDSPLLARADSFSFVMAKRFLIREISVQCWHCVPECRLPLSGRFDKSLAGLARVCSTACLGGWVGIFQKGVEEKNFFACYISIHQTVSFSTLGKKIFLF